MILTGDLSKFKNILPSRNKKEPPIFGASQTCVVPGIVSNYGYVFAGEKIDSECINHLVN
jgi:hypothetical protein